VFPVERAIAWAGGALFVAALALTGWWYVVFLGTARAGFSWPRLVFDTVLFSIFACHHSLFARPAVKTAISRVVPDRLIRSVYVWTASLLLMIVCLFWQPVGGVLYAHGGLAAWLHAVVQLTGLAVIALAVRVIDPLELAGIHQAAETAAPGDLKIIGPYHLVRHPIYLGWMLIVFGAARMTGDRVAFATISSAYLVVAVPWEEASLRRVFGAEYDRYARLVRWRIVPGIW